MHFVTIHRAETLADATAGAVSKCEGDRLPPELADSADVIGPVDDELRPVLRARKKQYLQLWRYDRDRWARPTRQQR